MEQEKFENLEELLRQPVFRHFARLCEIPHPSFKEKTLSDRVFQWAKEKGFAVRQDEWNNVLLRKPASPGYENRPGVMLQAHLDMVCQKAKGVDHDFLKDPIHLELDGDILSTGGRLLIVGLASLLFILMSVPFILLNDWYSERRRKREQTGGMV